LAGLARRKLFSEATREPHSLQDAKLKLIEAREAEAQAAIRIQSILGRENRRF
jgi:hypothetical protein